MTDNTKNSKPVWWISWYSPESLGGFELRTPWWRSGWMIEDNGTELTILVAAVRADNEDEAFEIIESSYDKEGTKIAKKFRRFSRRLDEGELLPWEQEGTRFPLGDWMEWE